MGNILFCVLMAGYLGEPAEEAASGSLMLVPCGSQVPQLIQYGLPPPSTAIFWATEHATEALSSHGVLGILPRAKPPPPALQCIRVAGK